MMKTKDRLEDVFKSEESFGGCNLNDKNCLIESLINRVPIKDILAYRNLLIDDNFKSIMEDADLAKCVEDFFKYDLNVAETSRKSYLHRNTLLYRLDKIEHLTGLNLRCFDDAVTFRILMIIYNLTN